MRVYTRCNNCHRRIYLRSTAKSRVHLGERIGFQFKLTCKYCNYKCKYDVEEVFARTNYVKVFFITIVALAAGIAGALVYLDFMQASTVPNELPTDIDRLNVSNVYVFGVGLAVFIIVMLVLNRIFRPNNPTKFNRNTW